MAIPSILTQGLFESNERAFSRLVNVASKLVCGLRRDLMEGKQQHSWEGRKDKLFFRGAKTGLRSYVANDSHFMSSAEVDVKFSGWTGDASQPFYSLPEHCDYRQALSECH